MPSTSNDSLWEKKLAFYLYSQNGVGRRTVFGYIQEYQKNSIKPEDIREHIHSLPKYYHAIKNIDFSFKKDEIEYFYYSKITALDAAGISVLYYTDREYPHQLKKSEDPPLFLFCKGNLGLVGKEAIGVVGTRKVTAYGKYVTQKIVRELLQDKYVIVSGGMYGVDEEAHRQALRHPASTIAVLGYGHAHAYPRRIASLLQEILAKEGLVVSEYFPEVEPAPAFFVARNRIIAGLSDAVVVTEAAQKSGSHGTALFAIDASRSVFAVPGPISNPYSEGTKWLINQGATLITSGYEVAEYFGKRSGHDNSEAASSEDDGEGLYTKVLAIVSAGPVTTQTISQETGFSLSTVLSVLSNLELERKLVKDGILWYLRQS